MLVGRRRCGHEMLALRRTLIGCAEPEEAGERVVRQRGRCGGPGYRLQFAQLGGTNQERPGNGHNSKIGHGGGIALTRRTLFSSVSRWMPLSFLHCTDRATLLDGEPLRTSVDRAKTKSRNACT